MLTSKPGYSLRKHIGNALKSRSAAIRTALVKYNDAAANLQPPRSPLSWEEVVEYAFLADFDLLRDTREDIRKRPWATPAARLAMDSYFKLLRAEEEIQRLNLEIPRFATFIRDEDHYLHTMEQVHTSQPALAFQIRMKRLDTGRYATLHMKILNQITCLKGFTGGSLYGTSISDVSLPVEVAPVTQQQQPLPTDGMVVNEEIDREQDLEEEQAGEDRDEAVLGAYYSVLEFSYDNTTVPDNVHQ
jgi:hypothetical protein